MSKRAYTISFLADSDTGLYSWFDERCIRIAQGKPLSHCWRNYGLSSAVFFDWLLESPHRAVQVANALSVAQVARWEKAAAERRANRAAWAEVRQMKIEEAKSPAEPRDERCMV